jgi:hypothetical protein
MNLEECLEEIKLLVEDQKAVMNTPKEIKLLVEDQKAVMNTPKKILQPLVERLRNECNREVNGRCFSRICLKRGGWKKGDPVDYSLATCKQYEQVQALEKLLK